jgi:hypothetical protein
LATVVRIDAGRVLRIGSGDLKTLVMRALPHSSELPPGEAHSAGKRPQTDRGASITVQ